LLLAGANALVWGSESSGPGPSASATSCSASPSSPSAPACPNSPSRSSAPAKGEHGLALGNVIGSNAFNLLAVIGVAAAVISPADAGAAMPLLLHLPVMVGFTLAVFLHRLRSRQTYHAREGAPPEWLHCSLGFCTYHASRHERHLGGPTNLEPGVAGLELAWQRRGNRREYLDRRA
jgi:hypothetical protein